MTAKSIPLDTGHPCVSFIKEYSFNPIMDAQVSLFRYLNQQEINSSETIVYPLVGEAKQCDYCGKSLLINKFTSNQRFCNGVCRERKRNTTIKRKEYMVHYRSQNKEKLLHKSKIWYSNHKFIYLKYRLKYRDKIKEYRFKDNKRCIDCQNLISNTSTRCTHCSTIYRTKNYIIPTLSFKKRSEKWLNKSFERYKHLTISSEAEQVLLGSLLGDGHLNKQLTTTYRANHCNVQKEYLEWKHQILNLPSGNIYQNTNKKAYYFDTLRLPHLNYYHTLFYINGKKRVNQEILDKITPFGIAVWYMDDGSLHSGKSQSLVISTQSFNYDENTIIQNYFINKYDIHFKVDKYFLPKYNKTYYRLILRRFKEIQKFVNLVKPFIHPSMQYKLKYREITPKIKTWDKEYKQGYMVTYRKINRQKIKLKTKEYKLKHRDKYLQWKQNWYWKHKEQISEKAKLKYALMKGRV